MSDNQYTIKEFDELKHLIQETVKEALAVEVKPAIQTEVNVKINKLREEFQLATNKLDSVLTIVQNDYAWKSELLWLKNVSSWTRKTGSGAWILIKAIIPLGSAMGLLYAFYKFIIK